MSADETRELTAEPDPPRPAFCDRCGARLGGDEPCTACASHVVAASSPAEDSGISIRGALRFYFAMLGACLAGWIAASQGAQPAHADLFATLALSVVVLAGVAATWSSIAPLLARSPTAVGLGLAVAFAMATVAVAEGVIQGLVRLGAEDDSMSAPILQAGWGWSGVLLLYVVQPAIFEELAFRGTVMSALGRVLQPLEVVLVSALMFMILHISPARYPHTFALGLGAGYLRLRTGSLWPCMALHGLHNLAFVGAEWWSVT